MPSSSPPAPYLLAIETSGRAGSVALLDAAPADPVVLAEQSLPETERTARSLVPALRELLARAAANPRQGVAVAVASGPGSFTGLRIGVTAAKTWAYATQSALVEVNTLDVLAAQAGDRAGCQAAVWAVLDAQRGDLFVARYDSATPLPSAGDPTQLLSADAWLAAVQPGDLVVGQAAARYAERLPAGVVLADEATCQPRAATVGLLGARLLAAGQTIAPFALAPRYHRSSAAEEKRR